MPRFPLKPTSDPLMLKCGEHIESKSSDPKDQLQMSWIHYYGLKHFTYPIHIWVYCINFPSVRNILNDEDVCIVQTVTSAHDIRNKKIMMTRNDATKNAPKGLAE